ncbi:hypothetical protein D9611_009647 [Ephemerocybe angulata]|uniref:AB hydrolase-1 domain-containing protein n=1 Tax=Ephemerocybe angulata TaxID=980116 RepID=A0A8H5FGI6_9AGAR|nr:hypothetical protein D9611_009647 [Tulosesus angulatus]
MAALTKLSALISILTVIASAQALYSVPNGKCSDVLLPVSVTAQNAVLNITAPHNQQELTDFIAQFTSLTSNSTTQIIGAPVTNNATYKIWTELCLPTKQDSANTVEFAVHGINFDHTYWNFGGPGSKYNYVDSALKAGHAILIYDRLGTGKSDKPDGIKEVQTATEVEIAAQLVKFLRGNPFGSRFNRIIGIGHSYGSVQLIGMLGKYGNLLDATIITGFTPFSGGLNTAFGSLGWAIASEQNPKRFGALPSSYIATQGIINDQQVFFRFGNYDPAVLKAAEAGKATATLGEVITQGAGPAANYTNPVFVVTGDKDYIFCGGNCYQAVNNFTNLVDFTKAVFPGVSNFSTFIPAETGHGVNLHLSAPQVYSKIQEWIAQL